MQQLDASRAVAVEHRRRSVSEDEFVMATARDNLMSPRYETGESLIFNRSLQPKVGDDVIIICKNGMTFVRRLDGFDGWHLKLVHYFPHRQETKIALADVVSVHPCVTYEPPIAIITTDQ